MSRKKTKLQWIADDAARRASLKKRRRGLLKKAQELAVLCGVKVCLVVYGPPDPLPEIWPSADEAATLLRSFRCLPEYERRQRRLDQDKFLLLQARKTREKINKERKASMELHLELLFFDCLMGARRVDMLSTEETTALSLFLEIKLRDITAKVESLRTQQMVYCSWSVDFPPSAAPHPLEPPPPPPPPLPLAPNGEEFHEEEEEEENKCFSALALDGLRRPGWFLEGTDSYGMLSCYGDGSVPPLMDDLGAFWLMESCLPFY
ncbi:agamous-like MADS-box protein AGL80 [Wolffia australiana]